MHALFDAAAPHVTQAAQDGGHADELLKQATNVSAELTKLLESTDVAATKAAAERSDLRASVRKLTGRIDELMKNEAKIKLRAAMTFADDLILAHALGVPFRVLKTSSMFSLEKVTTKLGQTIKWLDGDELKELVITQAHIDTILHKQAEFAPPRGQPAAAGKRIITSQGNKVAHADPRGENLEVAADIVCGEDKVMRVKYAAAIEYYEGVVLALGRLADDED